MFCPQGISVGFSVHISAKVLATSYLFESFCSQDISVGFFANEFSVHKTFLLGIVSKTYFCRVFYSEGISDEVCVNKILPWSFHKILP